MKNKNILYITNLIRIIPKPYFAVFILCGILLSIGYVCSFLIPLVQKEFIDTAIKSKTLTNNYLFYLILINMLYYGFTVLIYILATENSVRINKYLFVLFWKKIIFLKKETILKNGTGYYYDILSHDIETANQIFDENIFSFLFSSIQAIFILVLLFTWSKVLFITIIAAYIFTIVLSILMTRWRVSFISRMRESASTLAQETIDTLSNNFIIKIFLKVGSMQNIIAKKLKKTLNYGKKSVYINTMGSLVISVVQTLLFVFMLIYSMNLIINNHFTYGMLIAVISYFAILFAPINHFFSLLSLLTSVEISLGRLYSIDKNSTLLTDTSYSGKMIEIKDFKALTCKDIVISYRNEELSNTTEDTISFSLDKYKKVGIVGLSGEGKTTLLKLIYRELVPKQGSITVNKCEIQSIPLLYYYNYINILSQDIEISNNDLMYNITLGKARIDKDEEGAIREKISSDVINIISQMEDIIHSASTSNIKYKRIIKFLHSNPLYHELFSIIDLIPENPVTLDKAGYLLYVENLLNNKMALQNRLTAIHFHSEYIICERVQEIIDKLELEKLKGRPLGENGSFISGGEKQRIIFARFLLKDGFDFFILDEPFTALDSINEKKLLHIAADELSGKTGIVISHKFNILSALTDECIVLENGKISQQGMHKDLVKKNGLYNKLYSHFVNQRI